MKAALGWAGKNGTLVVIAGVVLGFAVPGLSALARPWLAAAIFVFTFGSLLKFDLSSFRKEFVQTRRNVAMIAWATFGIPLLVENAAGLAGNRARDRRVAVLHAVAGCRAGGL